MVHRAVLLLAAFGASGAGCGSPPAAAPVAPVAPLAAVTPEPAVPPAEPAPCPAAAPTPVAATPASPAPPPPAPARKNAPHETFTLDSKVIGETRRINLYTPPGYAGASAKLPVLYLLDGGDAEDFPSPHILATIDEAIRAKEMQPYIVVGIENTERRRDLLFATTVEAETPLAPHAGGSAKFRRFLHDELMPEIARRVRTTGKAAIMGESAAGLFVVETFFAEPQMFETFVAISPGVQWNAGQLVAAAPAWLQAHPRLVKTLYIAGAGDDDLDDQRSKLGQILRTGAPRGLTWFYEPRSDLRHANIYETVAPSVLRRLFRPAP
jgi:predicted alpha/beta superfamily hydrolase